MPRRRPMQRGGPKVGRGWIATFSGARFYYRAAGPHPIILVDVAHALAMTCRYGGHTQRFYSVAEHACILADYTFNHMGHLFPGRRELAAAALDILHHDDPEFVIGDIPTPFKKMLPIVKRFETTVDRAVAKTFGTQYPHPTWLKDLDSRILEDEWEQCMTPETNCAPAHRLKPLGVRLHFWSPDYAKHYFIERHNYYMSIRNGKG